jgi:hypothetical protein
MTDSGAARLADQPWPTVSYRDAMARLLSWGWLPCGVGDWAVGMRSPDGLSAARVCPFDPAYPAFLELCRRCAGNPWVPRVELAAELEGGGSLTVLEFLTPVDAEFAAQVAGRWRAAERDGARQPEPDPDFEAVRRTAQQIDAEFREHMPWWDGFDLNGAHVRRGLDGRPVLIDVFCMDGAAMYGQILEDATVVRRRIGRDRMRHMVEIPYIARESSVQEIEALRKALAEVP